MSTRLTAKTARERAAALALETEFRRWRREQGMDPTPGEIFDLRVWALLVVWKGGGVMAPFDAEE